jgi:hypothetical protein
MLRKDKAAWDGDVGVGMREWLSRRRLLILSSPIVHDPLIIH